MIRKIALAVIALAFAVLAGCAAPGSTAPALPKLIITPQQLVTDFCPVVNADLKAVAASPLLNASQKLLLNGDPANPLNPGIISVNASVCAAGGMIDVTNLETLNNTAFPALITLVGALPMLPNQPAILLGLTLAQPILSQVLAMVQAQQAAAATSASTPAAASAPAAASTPLAGAPLQ